MILNNSCIMEMPGCNTPLTYLHESVCISQRAKLETEPKSAVRLRWFPSSPSAALYSSLSDTTTCTRGGSTQRTRSACHKRGVLIKRPVGVYRTSRVSEPMSKIQNAKFQKHAFGFLAFCISYLPAMLSNVAHSVQRRFFSGYQAFESSLVLRCFHGNAHCELVHRLYTA